MPTLRIKMADGSEAIHTVCGDRVTIGRRPDNTIQILDRSVSAYHAELLHEGDHYRLHDLGSTNLSFVDGEQVMDYHLHQSCKMGFGNIQAEFDAAGEEEKDETRLTPAQMEKDMAFLRAENQDLLNKINGLERRIDILSSARLVISGKSDTSEVALPEQIRRLSAERDEQRFHASGLKLELDKLREELRMTAKERDDARQENEMLRAQAAVLQRELGTPVKGDTQKIPLQGAGQPESTEAVAAEVGA